MVKFRDYMNIVLTINVRRREKYLDNHKEKNNTY